MNLQDLKYFKYLAESLSFTATAEHFYVSQPSISTALKRLESEFETTLVDRRKTLKRIQLTAAGQLLYEQATEALGILQSTKQKIQDIQHETVYYGFLPTIGGHFLPQIMPHIKQYTNSLQLIEEESSDIMLDLVQEKKVPLAIIGHDSPQIASNTITQIPILEKSMALWVAPDHPLAGKEHISAKDINSEVFISLSEGYTHHRIFERWAEHNQIKDPNIVYANEIRTVHSVAESTQIIGFMSDIIVDEHSELVKVSLREAPPFYISLIMNTDADHSLVQQEFNEAVVNVVTNNLT